jgi:magnesium-transporting ATPase (P-type)
MVLKNTPSVTGVVIYTGHETTIQMNNEKARYKSSKLMLSTNTKIKMIFASQIIISLIAAGVGVLWQYHNFGSHWYLGFTVDL